MVNRDVMRTWAKQAGVKGKSRKADMAKSLATAVESGAFRRDTLRVMARELDVAGHPIKSVLQTRVSAALSTIS